MAKYKIKVIGHQLKGKVIAKAGEIVDESQLLSDAYKLEEEKFIEKVVEKSTSKKTPVKAKATK